MAQRYEREIDASSIGRATALKRLWSRVSPRAGTSFFGSYIGGFLSEKSVGFPCGFVLQTDGCLFPLWSTLDVYTYCIYASEARYELHISVAAPVSCLKNPALASVLKCAPRRCSGHVYTYLYAPFSNN